VIDLLLARYIYLFVLALLAIGLYGVLAKNNLVKKVIGLTIFSTAIYLFFIEGSLQLDGTAPVIDERGSDPALYVDPLPHLLILTAIVVGVGVVGVALSLLVRIHRSHGSLDEAVVAARLARGETTAPTGADPADADRAATDDPATAAPALAVDLDEAPSADRSRGEPGADHGGQPGDDAGRGGPDGAGPNGPDR
jgi:multicomponent Na+:H+ antiporter subunit C